MCKVQKILRNVTVSENMFQSFNMEIYEKIFLVFQVVREKYYFYNIFGYILSFLVLRRSDLH